MTFAEIAAQTEVNDLNVIIAIHKDIFGLEIPMGYTALVNVIQAGEQLQEEFLGFLLWQVAIVDYVVKKVAACAIFHDKVETALSFNEIIKFGNMWMPEFL